MKITHTAYPINRKSCWVELPREIATALQLSAGTNLTAVLLPSKIKNARKPSLNAEERLLARSKETRTVLLTSVPSDSWGRLVRAGFVLPPGPGRIWLLIKALAELGLTPRHVENIEGTRLETSGGKGPPDLFSNVFCILNVGDPNTFIDACPLLDSLIKGDNDESSSNLVEDLNGLLKAKIEMVGSGQFAKGSDEIRLAWVDPLRSLNRLDSEMLRAVNDSDMPQYSKIELVVETGSKRRARGSEDSISTEAALTTFPGRPHLVDESKDLGISFLQLRHSFDLHSTTVIDTSKYLGYGNLAAVLSVDHDERVLRADFVPLSCVVLADFEMLFPAGPNGYLWFLWIAKEVQEAGGTILGSQSKGRHGHRWIIVNIKASFKFTRDATEQEKAHAQEAKIAAIQSPERPCLYKVARITQCFRALKGKELFSSEDRQSEAHKDLIKELSDSGGAGEDGPDETESLLYDVKLRYYWGGHPGVTYRSRYAPCKFDFSRPLTLKSHAELFPQALLSEDSRLRLAVRIHENLARSGQGSIVIVGAHRSGKTSLISMISDFMNGHVTAGLISDTELYGALCCPAVCLRINAAVTPPQELFIQVIKSALSERRKLDDSGTVEKTSEKESQLEDRRRKLEEARGIEADHPDRTSEELKARQDDLISVKLRTLKAFLLSAQKVVNRVLQGEELVDFDGVLLLAEYLGTVLPLVMVKDTEPEQSEPTPAVTSQILRNLEERFRETSKRRVTVDTDAERARELRNSLEILQKTIEGMPMEIQSLQDAANTPSTDPKGTTGQLPLLVIAVDEIMESAAWGGDWALPAWRRAIEAPEFQGVRWLFASSRPVAKATAYSPLSNALREYNLGPLTTRETNFFIERIDYDTLDDSFNEEGTEALEDAINEQYDRRGEGVLRPTVTFNARQYIHAVTGGFPFLLQVVCTHLYEEAICHHIPVASTRLARLIIKNYVLSDISDFFSSQWRDLRAEGLGLAEELALLTENWPNLLENWGAIFDASLPRVSKPLGKALERRGLGHRSVRLFVVPLFAMWLQDRLAGENGRWQLEPEPTT